MKKFLSLFFFLSVLLPGHAQLRKRQDIQKNPQDITEYFLLIPSEKNWALDGDEFDPFIGRQQYFKTTPKRTVTIDKKNAYLSILDNTDELESRFSMCYFVKADKTKLIAVSYYGAGGDCDSYLLKFYTYAAGKWTDETKKVLPTISLKQFNVQEKEFLPVDFLYTLPQFGTSISVKASPVCEQSGEVRGMDFMTYFEKFKKLPYKNLSLKWNKDKGIFEVGELK